MSEHTDDQYLKSLKRLGWSQEEMAKLLDVTRPTIKKVLNGQNTKLSIVAKKLLVVISRQTKTIDEMKQEAFREYIERHYLKEVYLELAREVVDLSDED